MLSRSEKVRRDVRRTAAVVHCEPLIRFLRSAALRRRHAKIVYVHIPKTGGTSMWASLTRAFPSHVYYPSIHAFLTNPPPAEDYPLIGLHFTPTVLLQSLSNDDWLIGMVRQPTQRFLSAIMHFRRQSEDPETFTAAAKAMREMKLVDYLETDYACCEARLQLITFGSSYRQSLDTHSDEQMLESSVALAQRHNVVFAPSERSDAFSEFLAQRLSFQTRPLDRFNASEPAARMAHFDEFDRAIPRIEAINAREREFYGFVCKTFSALRAEAQVQPLRAASSRRARCLRLIDRLCVE